MEPFYALVVAIELVRQGRAAMSTVSWKDVAFTETPGPTSFGELTFTLKDEHIARWKEDPDGRHAVMPTPEGVSPVDLGKFYPSL